MNSLPWVMLECNLDHKSVQYCMPARQPRSCPLTSVAKIKKTGYFRSLKVESAKQWLDSGSCQ